MTKWIVTFVTVLVLLPTTSSWADKKEEKNDKEKDTQSEIVNSKEVSKVMAEAWCEKLAQCDPNAQMGPKECRKVLEDSFKKGFKNVPDGQKIEVSKGALSQCQESIAKDSCEGLKAAQQLPGCDFISKLNRS